MARDQAVGLLFTLPVNGAKHQILLTGDMGLFPLKRGERKPTADTSSKDHEVWQHYLRLGSKRPERMVVHIGSIRPEELRAEGATDPSFACYPNHLGIIGTARVITMCQPRLAVVSEFGEEMRGFRIPLVKGLQTNLLNPFFRDRGKGHTPQVVPGDLAFIYDIGTRKFYDCVGQDWADAGEIDFDGGGGGGFRRCLLLQRREKARVPGWPEAICEEVQ